MRSSTSVRRSVVLAVLLGLVWLPTAYPVAAAPGGGSPKQYEARFEVPGGFLTNGVADQVVTLELENTTATSTKVGAANVTIPPGFDVSVEPDPESSNGLRQWNAQVVGDTIELRSDTQRDRLRQGEVLEVEITITNVCSEPGEVAWPTEARQSNRFRGKGNAVEGNDPVLTVQGLCQQCSSATELNTAVDNPFVDIEAGFSAAVDFGACTGQAALIENALTGDIVFDITVLPPADLETGVDFYDLIITVDGEFPPDEGEGCGEYYEEEYYEDDYEECDEGSGIFKDLLDGTEPFELPFCDGEEFITECVVDIEVITPEVGPTFTEITIRLELGDPRFFGS